MSGDRFSGAGGGLASPDPGQQPCGWPSSGVGGLCTGGVQILYPESVQRALVRSRHQCCFCNAPPRRSSKRVIVEPGAFWFRALLNC